MTYDRVRLLDEQVLDVMMIAPPPGALSVRPCRGISRHDQVDGPEAPVARG